MKGVLSGISQPIRKCIDSLIKDAEEHSIGSFCGGVM